MKKVIHLRNGRGYDEYISLLKQTTEWIAKEYGVSSDSIRLTCGATGALDAILSLFDRGSVLATMPFEYFDIPRLAKSRGITISALYQLDNAHSNSIETFTEWLRETRPDGCYISLPNNPNGQEYSKEALRNIFVAMKGKIVIIDQALLAEQVIPFQWFIENSGACRLFVVRSFSKTHGLVGERIGMLFSDEASHIHMYAHAPSANSLRLLRKKWKSNYASSCLLMIHRNYTQLEDWANKNSDILVVPTRTNCACIHFHNSIAQDISKHLMASGVFVNSNIDLGIDGNFIRVDITVPEKSIKILLLVIDEYLAEH